MNEVSAKTQTSIGRPSIEPTAEDCDLAFEFLSENHLTNKKLAKVLKVSERTINRWIKRNEAFRRSVQDGRDAFNSGNTENSLLKRAKGYRYKEKTSELAVNPLTGQSELVVTKVVEKELPPETNAIKFYLTNRDRERWRERTEHAVVGAVQVLRPEAIKKGE